MKRIVVGLLFLVLCAVVAILGFGRPYLARWLKQRLEDEITRAMHVPAQIEALTLSVSPLGVRLAGIVVGGEAAIVRIERGEVSLHLLDSIAEGKPVLTAEVNAPTFDLTRLPARQATVGVTGKNAKASLPPLHLKKLEVTGARLRFRMGEQPAALSVAHLAGELNTGLLRQAVSADIEAGGVELQRNSYAVKLSEIHATGGADAGGLFVQTATVRGEGITASVNATSTPHRPRVVATFYPSLLGVVVDELSFIGGEAHVEGSVRGDIANPLLDARVVVERAAIAQHPLGDLDTHVLLAGSNLRFDDMHLVSAVGEVTGAVELIMDREVPLNAELGWQDVDIEGLLAVIGVQVPLSNRLRATTSVHGSLDPLDLRINGSGVLQTVGAGAPKETAGWDIEGRVRPVAVETQLELTQPAGNHLGVQFVLNEQQLGGTVKLAAANLAALNAVLPRPVRALMLTGQGEATAAFGGTMEHPTIEGSLTMRDLTVMGTQVPRLSSDFGLAAGKLTTQSTRIDTGAGNAELSGVVALGASAQNSWQVSLHDLSTDFVLGVVQRISGVESPLSGGTVNGAFRCRGEWERANMQGDLAVRSLQLGREPLDVDMNVTTVLPRWTLRLNAVHAGNETLNIDATGEGLDRLALNIDTTPIDLAKWRSAGRRRVEGVLALHGRISGELLRPDGWIELNGSGLRVRGYQVGDLTLRAEGQGGSWTVSGETFERTIGIDVTLRTGGTLPYTLAVKWRGADLARLNPGDESLHVTSDGEITLAGSLREITAPTGAVLVSQLEARRGEYRVSAAEPIRVEVDRGRFRIRSFVLEGQGSRLTAAGEFNTSGQVALDVQGEADLVLLELIGPPFQSSQGHAAVIAQLQRTPSTGWHLHGQVTVRDAVLDAGLPVTFTNTDGDFTFAGSHIQIDRLAGKAGGGEFTMGGAIDLNRGPEVSWAIKEVSLNVPTWLEERVSGSGRVDGTWRAMSVSGDIEVLNALYDRRLELTDFVPWFKAQVTPVPRTEAAAIEVRLDLHIHASGGLFVDNNFAKAEMRADLRVRGTTDKPVLTGTVEFLSGEVTFRKRTFIVTGGSIDFRDPLKINPVLNISAEARISTTQAEYTVYVAVSGTADAPRVELSADDPSLSQNDILSLITTGTTMAQAQREGGRVGFTDLLGLVPTGPVEERFRNLLGVDRFEIESVYSRDTGSSEPRVTIGKDITDRLRVQGSAGLGVDAHRSMQVEYRLSYRLSLLSSWEDQTQQQSAAFGGEIKFRQEFRRFPFSLLGSSPVCAPQSDAQ